MTKICVFSDSHGSFEHAASIIDSEKPDAVYHLGDGTSDVRLLERRFPALKILCVSGNMDASGADPTERLEKVENVKIFLAHGHTYNVKNDTMLHDLCARAMERDARVVLFGHTHHALLDRKLGMDIMNPGTIGCGEEHTYGVLTIDGKTAVCEVKPVETDG